MSAVAFYIDGDGYLAVHGSLEAESESEALELSILKWKAIAQLTAAGHSVGGVDWDTCALCHWARDEDGHINCYACMIGQDGDHADCQNTPYADFVESADEQQEYDAAMEEIKYLESFRQSHG